ncbi:MAG: PhzF family phenazine biosynthesis protein [Robiginitomaculum sp.]|nr:PhzF family phenazine biosynthesis protein [Robiginitomaculum sp.]
MTTHPIYQVDAFASQLFAGNPAAVVPLDKFFDTKTMQAIAFENNLSETAFVVRRRDGSYDLRWFTPLAEVDFCGHATIAAAHVLLSELDAISPLVFHTKVGPLEVTNGTHEYVMRYTMRSPAFPMMERSLSPALLDTFNGLPTAAWQSRKNVFLMFPSANTVANFQPDFSAIKSLSSEQGVDEGIVIMAQGDGKTYNKYDFISRYFVPAFGIDEDPVTGSNHASLAPFWAKRLGKSVMTAYQASGRGGVLDLSVTENQVFMTGHAVTYLRGEIFLP